MPGSIKTESGEPVKLTAEIGYAGAEHYGGYLHEEWDPDLRGLRGVKIFDEMRRNDPTVAVGLRLIKWMLGKVVWSVEKGGETPADEEAALFVESCRDDCSHTWSKLIRDALTCLDFGFAWLEVVFKQRNGPKGEPPSRYDDGRIGWRKISLIPHNTLSRWDIDEHGGIRAMVQQPSVFGYAGEVTIPIEKSILFRLDDERNNPEGLSLLRAAYLPWYLKKNLQEIEAIGMERDLTGVLIINMPVNATADDRNKARELLEQYKADDMTGFIAPTFGPGEHERWRFEIIASPGSKSIDTDKIIQRYQVEIARTFLAQFLMLGQAAIGSFALSKDQSNIFEVALGAILQNLEETMNRFMVPMLFRLNDFGKLTALPQLKPGKISRGDVEKFALALKALTEAGLLTPNVELERFIRQEVELPALPEDAEAAPEEDTGDEEELAKEGGKQQREPKKGAEKDDDQIIELPDPNDDDLWERLERESNKRLGKTVKRTVNELFSFARKPYDYEGKIQERQTQFRADMRDLAQQLREGQISQAAWQQRSREKILVNTLDGYRLGVAQTQGLPPSKVKLTPTQRKQANEAIGEQYKYFAEFGKTVKGKLDAGDELTSAIDARANLYGGSVRSASSQAQLDEQGEKKLRWVRNKNDSCETCLGNEGKVKTAKEWKEGGVWPSRGTKCNGQCGCSLLKE